MLIFQSTTVRQFVISILSILSAYLFCLIFYPLISPNFTMIFLVPVIISGIYGGLRVGLFSAFLSTFVIAYFLFPPFYSLTLTPVVIFKMFVFVIITLLVNLLYEREKQAQRTVEMQREQLQVTLGSIGDGVIATDTDGNVTFINPVAQQLTGWSQAEASGKSLYDIFQIVNEETRQPVENPVERVLREGKIVGLANHTVLIAKDRREFAIDDSGAPIFNGDNIIGAVLVFRDITEKYRAEKRLRLLQSLTADLLAQSTSEETATVIVNRLSSFLKSSVTAVYRFSEDGEMAMLLAEKGVQDSLLDKFRHVMMTQKIPITDVMRNGESVWVESPEQYHTLYPELAAVADVTRTQAFACFALKASDRPIGGILFSFDHARAFDQEERTFLHAIADQCSQALIRARLYEQEQKARHEAEAANQRVTFLSDASKLLSASLDYKTTLDNVARLVVPEIADWCVIDLIDEKGEIQLTTVSHVDPAKVAWAYELRKMTPVNMEATNGVAGVLKSGEPEMYPVLTDEMLTAMARDPQHLEILLQVGYRSALLVPLTAQGRTFGVLTLVATKESGRYFSRDTLVFAEELARRAATAVENARLHQEAHQQRQHLYVTLASIGDAVIATDAAGKITFINPVAQRLTGWSEANATGAMLPDVFRIINETTRETVESPFDKVIREGNIVGLANHTLLITRDGKEIPIDDSGAPIRDSSGEISGVILVFRDIEERKRSERRIEQSLDLSMALSQALTRQQVAEVVVEKALDALDGTVGTVWLFTEDRQHLELLNRSGLPEPLFEQYRITPLTLVSITSDTVRTGQPVWIETLEDYIARYPHFEANTRQNGSQSSVGLPMFINGEVVGGIHLSFKDPKPYNEADERFFQLLAQKCAHALERAGLYEAEAQARREAEAANALKIRFLGMISHELRTPLTSIKGFASSLLAEDVTWSDEDQHQFLTILDNEADRLKWLVEQLLDISALQGGTFTIRAEPLRFNTIINIAQPQLQIVTPAHELVLDIPENLPQVMVDKNRISQVLVNLVQNATKFSPPGSRIMIAAKEIDHGVQIDVRDQGSGIPVEARQYVFEAFRQAEQKGVRQKGAGLGLAICKGIVEGHGGRIWIADDVTVGTTISFTLPCA